jgi:hypothetical protein
MAKRWVKFMGKWYEAEECEDEEKGLYYLINGHIYPFGELDEIGEEITKNNTEW